jgi:hypothetical protein
VLLQQWLVLGPSGKLLETALLQARIQAGICEGTCMIWSCRFNGSYFCIYTCKHRDAFLEGYTMAKQVI